MINDVWRNKETEKLYVLVCECDIGSEPGYVFHNATEQAFRIRTVSRFLNEYELLNAGPGNVKFVNILEEVRFK